MIAAQIDRKRPTKRFWGVFAQLADWQNDLFFDGAFWVDC
jgi:hypothetical protein